MNYNDIDSNAYMIFWQDSVDDGTLVENVSSDPSVKYYDCVLYET